MLCIAERAIGQGEPAEHCPIQIHWKLGAPREARLEVVDRYARLTEACGQFCEYRATRVAAKQRVGGGGAIELSDGVVDPGHAFDQRDLRREACLQDRL